jgi:hypothetical protein
VSELKNTIGLISKDTIFVSETIRTPLRKNDTMCVEHAGITTPFSKSKVAFLQN